MYKRKHELPVIFHASFSSLVAARTKKHALLSAEAELNRFNFPLEHLQLEKEKGNSALFQIHQVETLDWHDVEHTERSNQYRVFGRMELSLFLPKDLQFTAGEVNYYLPPSFVYENPVLSVPAAGKSIFLTVLQQSMTWGGVARSAFPLDRLA